MTSKAISKMAMGKAAGTSRVVAEKLKSAGENGVKLVRDLIEEIIREGCIPSE